MSALPDYSARKIIDHLVGKTSFTMPSTWIALFTTLPSDAAAGGVEVSGGSYARKATTGTDWNAAAGSAPASTSNAGALAFPTATADWAPIATPVIGWGLYDAATVGNPLFLDYMGNFDWQACNTTDTAGDTIACAAHGYAAGDAVVFNSEFGGGALPTGIAAGTLYYVIAGGLTTDVFKISATSGGAALDITGAGKGMVRKVLPKVIQNGDTPSFAAGALTIKAA